MVTHHRRSIAPVTPLPLVHAAPPRIRSLRSERVPAPAPKVFAASAARLALVTAGGSARSTASAAGFD
ncbi:hypothetical protein JNC05_05435 [Paraburkholderia ginsengiterrae]|nr:hypothetical protein [Paraburkholderia ginsengiterrae]